MCTEPRDPVVDVERRTPKETNVQVLSGYTVPQLTGPSTLTHAFIRLRKQGTHSVGTSYTTHQSVSTVSPSSGSISDVVDRVFVWETTERRVGTEGRDLGIVTRILMEV